MWVKTLYSNVDPSGLIVDDVWYDRATGLWLWKETWGSTKWRMATTLGIIIQAYPVGGGTPVDMTSKFYDYGGERYFVYTPPGGPNMYLWWGRESNGLTSNWRLTTCLGMSDYETWDGSQYDGDTWWSCATMTGTYQPRGAIRGSVYLNYDAAQTRVLAGKTFSGWTSLTQTGEYTAEGTAVGTKRFGFRRYTATGLSDVFLERLRQHDSVNTYEYQGDETLWLWRSGSDWYISTAPALQNADIGYWKKVGGSDCTGTFSRVFTGSGTAPEPETIVVAFQDYPTVASGLASEVITPGAAGYSTSFYQCQASIWLS